MISKTHISAQQPRGKQLNAKVCGSESAIFRLLSFVLFCSTTKDCFEYLLWLHETASYLREQIHEYLSASS